MQGPLGLCLGHKPRKPALGEGTNALRVPLVASVTLTHLWASNIGEERISQEAWTIDPRHQEPHFGFCPTGQQELPLPSVGEEEGWVLLVVMTEAGMSGPVLYLLSLLLLQQACALGTEVTAT